MNPLKSISINVGIPAFILIIFSLLIYNSAKLPAYLFTIAPYLFYSLSAIILWVSWHFNRNKFIFIVIPLVLIHLGFVYLSPSKATMLFLYASIIYPVHLMIFFSFKRERAFLNLGYTKGTVFSYWSFSCTLFALLSKWIYSRFTKSKNICYFVLSIKRYRYYCSSFRCFYYLFTGLI